MAIDLKLISELRQQTGAGLADCRKALEENGGDQAKALEYLRKKGAKTLSERADRVTKEGVIATYVHSNKKLAAMVALGCETDFVAKNQDFSDLAYELAMQVAATEPTYIKPENIPADVLENKKNEIRQELAEQGKTGDMVEKIMEGKLNKWYEEVCLMNQFSIKDDKMKMIDILNGKVAAIGEKVEVLDMYRMKI